MNSRDIIYTAMKTRGFTQTMLAETAKLKRVSNVSEMLRSTSMRVDNFVKLLNAMGFEVIVKDKNPANKEKWIVTNNDTSVIKNEINDLLGGDDE